MKNWYSKLFGTPNKITLTDNLEIDCGQYSLRVRTNDGSTVIVSTSGIDLYVGINHIRMRDKWVDIDAPTRVNGKVVE